MTAKTAINLQGANYLKSAVILLGIMGGIQVVDPVIGSIALVKASDSLNFTASQQSLAAGISTLALAATVIAGGVIADRIGLRRALILGLYGAAIADVIVASSDLVGPGLGTPLYMFGRAAAGVALGVVFLTSYALIKAVSGPNTGKAVGIYAVWNAVMAAVGGFIGGALATPAWPAAFLVVPVFAVAAALIAPKVLPNVDKIPGGRVDVLGLVCVGLGIVGLLYGVTNASKSLTAPGCWLSFLIGAIFLVIFVIVENKSANPAVPIKVFKSPFMIAAVLMGIMWNFGSGSITLQLSNYWQYVYNWNPFIVTIAVAPVSVMGLIAAVWFGGQMGRGRHPAILTLLGFGLIASGTITLLIVGPESSYWPFIPVQLLAGLGLTGLAVVQGNLYLKLSPPEAIGAMLGTKLTVGQFGYALGLSGSAAMVSTLTLKSVDSKLKAGDTGSAGLSSGEKAWDSVTSYIRTGTTDDSTLAQLTHAQIDASYISAFKIFVIVSAIAALIAGIVCWLMLRPLPMELMGVEIDGDGDGVAAGSEDASGAGDASASGAAFVMWPIFGLLGPVRMAMARAARVASAGAAMLTTQRTGQLRPATGHAAALGTRNRSG